MFTTAVTKKKPGRAAPKMRHHANSKSSISNHSSSTSSSDEELVIRRKNLPSGKSEAELSSRHRRPSSRSSVERAHGRRSCHPHPTPHHYHVQQTYSLDRSHPHPTHASGWCPPPPWSTSPSPWLYPPTEMYPAMQQQRSSCCCCQTPPVPCQVYRSKQNESIHPSIMKKFSPPLQKKKKKSVWISQMRVG